MAQEFSFLFLFAAQQRVQINHLAMYVHLDWPLSYKEKKDRLVGLFHNELAHNHAETAHLKQEVAHWKRRSSLPASLSTNEGTEERDSSSEDDLEEASDRGRSLNASPLAPGGRAALVSRRADLQDSVCYGYEGSSKQSIK